MFKTSPYQYNESNGTMIFIFQKPPLVSFTVQHYFKKSDNSFNAVIYNSFSLNSSVLSLMKR